MTKQYRVGDDILVKGIVNSEVRNGGIHVLHDGIDAFYSLDQIHEPQKLVVPKFVADWIEEKKKSGIDLHKSMAYEVKADVFRYIMDNSEIYARAWLDGYEIEQEQLYTVEIPNPNNDSKNVLVLRDVFGDVEMCKVNVGTYKQSQYCQLTESEIRKDFDWAWEWAEPVEADSDC